MPHLDIRLRTVAKQIRAHCHADIGSDHGKLLVALLHAGRIQSAIAIENKLYPFENSRRALIGLNGEARYADGLHGLDVGEAESLSICGMGGASMVGILKAIPQRVPHQVVLQPNCDEELVRRWGFDNGFHLVDEQIAWSHRPYVVLTYRSASGLDPAYAKQDRDAAFMFGPINLARRDQPFIERLIEERKYLLTLNRLSDTTHHRLRLIELVLAKQT